MALFKKILIWTITLSACNAASSQSVLKGEVRSQSKEIATTESPNLFIESARFNIEIHTWGQKRIKVTLESTDPKVPPYDVDLFEASFVSVIGNANDVGIKMNWKKTQVGTPGKQQTNSLVKQVPRMIINIPVQSIVNITNRFSDVVLNNEVAEATFNLVGGTLVASSINSLKLNANLAEIRVGNVVNADVTLESNSKFFAKRITNLTSKTVGSEFSYDGGQYAYIKSSMDEYIITTIDTLVCSKLSGTLKVGTVTKSLELQGTNSDMYIGNISAEVENVQIINRHANVRVPVNKFKNIFLDFEGLNTVIHAPIDLAIPKGDPTTVRKTYDQQFAGLKFTATRGKSVSNATRVKIFCDACTVDLR
jgi:hypothetical protein